MIFVLENVSAIGLFYELNWIKFFIWFNEKAIRTNISYFNVKENKVAEYFFPCKEYTVIAKVAIFFLHLFSFYYVYMMILFFRAW